MGNVKKMVLHWTHLATQRVTGPIQSRYFMTLPLIMPHNVFIIRLNPYYDDDDDVDDDDDDDDDYDYRHVIFIVH